jgi:hypothetical protein
MFDHVHSRPEARCFQMLVVGNLTEESLQL